MPNMDGTGPEGKGCMTGKKRGKCEGAKERVGCGRRKRCRNREN